MLYQIAFYTFLFQAVAFPILLIWSVYFVMVNLFYPSKRVKKTKRKKNENEDTQFKGPVIDALECMNCHSPLPLSSEVKECKQCGTPFSMPVEMVEILVRREIADKRLNEAIRYWKKAQWMTSGWIRSALLLLILWLIATPVILLIESTHRTDFDDFIEKWGSVGNAFLGVSFFTIVFWILILFITRGIISPRRQALLPELDFGEADAVLDAQTSCEHCTAQLSIQKGVFSAICKYCGTENFRKSFAWKMLNETKKHQHSVSSSLLKAMDAYRDSVEDALHTPAILIFILIILPFFLVVVPKFLFNIIQENLWVSVLVVLAGVSVWFIRDAYLRKRNRINP